MRFVILSSNEIPGFGGKRGPVLTPQEYDLHLVLKMISSGIDIREVMDNGEYRPLVFNDSRVMKAIDAGFTAKRTIGAEIPIVEIEEKKEEVIDKITSEEEELAELEKEIAALEKEEQGNDKIEIDELEEM